MPDFDDVAEWLEEAVDWVEFFANDIVIGLMVGLLLMLWFIRGREKNGTHPA
jgi:hypothetical protein